MTFRKLGPDERPGPGDVCIPVSPVLQMIHHYIPQDPEAAVLEPRAVMQIPAPYLVGFYVGWDFYRPLVPHQKSIHANPLPLP